MRDATSDSVGDSGLIHVFAIKVGPLGAWPGPVLPGP